MMNITMTCVMDILYIFEMDTRFKTGYRSSHDPTCLLSPCRFAVVYPDSGARTGQAPPPSKLHSTQTEMLLLSSPHIIFKSRPSIPPPITHSRPSSTP